MTSVDVVIPFAHPDGWRERELPFILSRLPGMQPATVTIAGSSKEFIENLPEGVQFLQIEDWSKPKAINYTVLNKCESDWLLILDSDVLLPFTQVREALEENCSISRTIRSSRKIVRLSMEQTETLLRTGKDVMLTGKEKVETVVTGGAFLIQRALFMYLRGFDERFDLYMEDTELKHRVAQAPGRVTICSGPPGLHLYHPPTARDHKKYRELMRQKIKNTDSGDRIRQTFSCIPMPENLAQPLPPLVPRDPVARSKKQRLAGKVAGGTFTPVLDYKGDIAASVQCHGVYLDRLPACMDAVDGQTYKPVEKILVLDGCDLPKSMTPLRKGWQLVRREDGTPNPGRNAALELTKGTWIWYVDGDDVHNPGYLQGAVPVMRDRRVGIVHANLRYSNKKTRATPAVTDYWGLRLRNYVSTSSVWRTAALKEAGGWQKTDRFDDWTCALNVTGCGWHTVRNKVPIEVTLHKASDHRNRTEKDMSHKWARSHAVVSLLAGRTSCWELWSKTMLTMNYPEKTHFYFLDNSKDKDYLVKVQDLAKALMDLGHRVTVMQTDLAFKQIDRYSRSVHVANLYNMLCQQITEDTVLFWEDDNVPIGLAAMHGLVDHWRFQKVGGICALYESRNNRPGTACAARSTEFWDGGIPLTEVKGRIMEGLGFLPGGFAIYHNAFVQQAMPFHVDYPKGKADGWDGKLSRTIREAGFSLDLDGTVGCDHLFKRS